MTDEKIHDLAFNALNVAIAHIQSKLGADDGSFAGVYFSGGMEEERFDDAVQMLESYIEHERMWAKDD